MWKKTAKADTGYDKKYLKLGEIASFGAAGFGRNMVYTLMSTFALVFFTDVLGIKPSHAGTLILVARIFDALNDPLMGTIVDRTNTKWGKMRPYLAVAPIPIIITTCFLFFAPNFEYAGRLAYAYVIYILWGMAFTVSDVPFWSLSSVMTPNPTERTSFLSIARIICSVGGILPTLIVPVLIDKKALGMKNGYLIAGIIFGVVGGLMSWLAFFGTKERVQKTEKQVSLGVTFKAVIQNKYLFLLLLSSVLGSCRLVVQTAGAYVANGIYGKATYLTIMTVMLGIGMFGAMGLLPFLQKKFDLKNIYIYSTLFGVVIQTIMIFLPYNNFYWTCAALVFAGVPLGIFNVVTYAMVADSADYIEWKTGQRTEGISFAFQTFMSKVMAGIAAFVSGLVLDAAAYDKAAALAGSVQSEKTQKAIYLLISLVPAISCVLALIPMFFYDLSGEKRKMVFAELDGRRRAVYDAENAFGVTEAESVVGVEGTEFPTGIVTPFSDSFEERTESEQPKEDADAPDDKKQD